MKLFKLAVMGFVVAGLLAGCSKSKKAENQTKTTTAQTQQAAAGTTGTQAEKTVEVAKIKKAVEALPEVAQKFRELSEKPQSTDQQKAVNDMMMAMDEVGKKHGFSDGQELLNYIDFIVQLSSMQRTLNNLDSLLNAMPSDRSNSPEVQQSVQQLKDNYKQIKEKYGDSVLVAVKNSEAQIDTFLNTLDQIRAEQAAKQQQKFQNVPKTSQNPQQQSNPKVKKTK